MSIVRGESFIREITDPAEFLRSAKVIRESFRTVAEEFGLTRENCPSHPSVMTVRWLRAKKGDSAKLYGPPDSAQFFGLFDGKRQIGFIMAEKGDPDENIDWIAPKKWPPEGFYWIEKLAVLPAHRHGGNGAKLIGYALDYVRKRGGETVCLGMINEHTVLKNWYLSLGFREVNTRNFPGLPFTVCFMERDTSPLTKSKTQISNK